MQYFIQTQATSAELMISILPSSMSRQTKEYTIGIWYFSANHTPLRSKNKDWLAQNQDNVSEWSSMSTWLLLLWANILKIQLNMIV